MNFYRDDQALQDLLAMYLPDDLFAHLLPHLSRLGGLAQVNSTSVPRSLTGTRRCSTPAIGLAATGNGSNTIRRIGDSKRLRTVSSASTP